MLATFAFHDANRWLHILAGIAGIALGLAVLALPKGDARHRRLGRITAGVAGACVAAALVGAFWFRSRPDLQAVTLLVASHLWSGLRAQRLRNNGRTAPDLLPPLAMLGAAGLIWRSWLHGGTLLWEPARLLAGIWGLAVFSGYDIVRTAFPARWRRWLGPAEHAMRMTSLIGSMVTVAGATLVPSRGGYISAIGSALAAMAALGFAVRAALHARRTCEGVAD